MRKKFHSENEPHERSADFMDLILWHHTNAEPDDPDLARRLTPKGRKQAAAMAAWLKAFLPLEVKVLSSPAVRTRQTADALTRKYDIAEELAPDQSPEQMLAAAGWPDAGGPVILVGHNPAISRLAALQLR